MSYVIAYDVGTSSVKAALLAQSGVIRATATANYPITHPQPNWTEQQPMDYWQAVVSTTHQVMNESQLNPNSVMGIAFSTQAMGIIPVNQQGEVLHPNITWVDGRAEKQAKQVMNRLLGKWMFKQIVGIEITGKDVIPKLVWLKQERPDIYKATHRFLDVNGYLKFKCTGKLVAEWSGACSYAFNLDKKDWEHLFFRLNQIDRQKLPTLVKSTDIVGTLTLAAAQELGLHTNVRVFGGCDDTQSAAMGTGAIDEGQAHIYLGTSAWVGVSTARNIKFKNGAVCLQSANPSQNLVVGITEMAGGNIDWLIQRFYAAEKEKGGMNYAFEILQQEMAKVPAGADRLLFTPWFLGERCPVSTTTTRSTIFNLGPEHGRGHFARAQCEGIAYNLRWIMDNMERDFGFTINSLRVTGGGSVNDVWMQALADITQRTIITTTESKMAGALGVAMCAFVGSGLLKDFAEVQQFVKTKATFYPTQKNKFIYDTLFQQYQNLYKALKPVYDQLSKKTLDIRRET